MTGYRSFLNTTERITAHPGDEQWSQWCYHSSLWLEEKGGLQGAVECRFNLPHVQADTNEEALFFGSCI